MKRHRTTCFISAPYGLDTHVLRDELVKRDVDWRDPTTVSMHSILAEGVREAITQCDFLCAVVHDLNSRNPNSLFEVGVAVGLGKPVLLIADRDVHVPSDLASLHRILANASDREAIGFQLDVFLGGLKTKVRGASTKRSYKGLYRAGKSSAESDVAKLFERAGFLFSEGQELRDGPKVDLAVWIDGLVPVFGSPLLVVEVKNLWHPIKSIEAVERVGSYVDTVSAGAGLIVYTNPASKGRSQMVYPFVFSVSFTELSDWLGAGEFVERMRSLRNRAVHGS